MELSYEEVTNTILRIATNKNILKVDNGSKKVWLVFNQPDNLIKLRALSVYDEAYADALKDGLLPSNELEELLKSRNIFTEEDQSKVNDIESRLKGQRAILAKTTKIKARKERLIKIINDLEYEVNEIKYKKYSKMVMSAEVKADEYKQGFICSKCVNYSDEIKC